MNNVNHTLNNVNILHYRNFLAILSLAIISFFSIDAYAATLSVSIDGESNPEGFTAIISGPSVGGTQSQEFIGRQVVFEGLGVGEYTIALQSGGNFFEAQILNPVDCDGTIATIDDDEDCEVRIGNQRDGNTGGALGLLGALALGTLGRDTVSTTASAIEDKENDPPFRACLDRVRAFEEIKDRTTTEEVLKVVQTPSSAQYFIKGIISGEELKKIIHDNGRKDATIRLINDLHMQDLLPISHKINTKYKGQIVYYSEEGAKKDVLPFHITNINTECRYITLIQPSERLEKNPDNDNQWTPLTKEGKYKFKKSSIPAAFQYEEIGIPSASKNNLLIGTDNVVRPDLGNPLPESYLNPPWGSCVSNVARLGFQDNDNNGIPDNRIVEDIVRDASFAEYVMVGNLHDSISPKNQNSDSEELLIKITTDLNLSAEDSAKITNNENPFIKVELFLNPDQEGAQKMDMLVKEVSYNCHDPAFAELY